MPSGWTLEPNAEREVLLPWLEQQRDPRVVQVVLRYLAELLLDPWRPHLEDGDSGVFSVQDVAKTGVTIVWVLDEGRQQVVLAHVG